MLEVPCPPLFNAFSKSVPSLKLSAKSLQGVSDVAEAFAHPERLGEGNFSDGTIEVNDATACTVLHISQTRRYFLQAMRQPHPGKFGGLFSGNQKNEEDIPPKVISEISGLFSAWERWSPKKNSIFQNRKTCPEFRLVRA